MKPGHGLLVDEVVRRRQVGYDAEAMEHLLA